MRRTAILLLGGLLAAAALPAQVSPPVGERGKAGRGLTPAASFALSEIETVNLVNGNLLLRMPVVSLPPGRGGSSFTLHLLYNSQIYDVQKGIGVITDPLPENPDRIVLFRDPIPSSEGGWRWGFQYGLEYEFKFQGENRPCGHILDKFAHKMRVNFPDGSSHLLRLVNSEATVSDDEGDGYYAYQPTGSKDDCHTDAGASDISGDVRYITTGGSFSHVVIHDDSSDPPSPWHEREWTIHLRDGARVHGVNDRTTSIVDRNGNTLDVEKGHCDNPATTVVEQGTNGASCTILRDDVGREIQIVEPPGNTDYVVAKGHGGTKLQWTLQRGSVDMAQAAYDCTTDHEDGTLPCNIGLQIPTISWLELPTTPNRQRYTFTYHGTSTGYGELKKMTFPARTADAGGNGYVTYSYKYSSTGTKKADNQTLLENPVVSKQLSYTEPITDATLTESWSYAIDETNDTSTVTAPDGGATKSYFFEAKNPTTANAWKAGLTWKVEQPNGDTVERYWAKNQAYNSPAIHSTDAGNPYVAAEYRTLGTKTAATKRTVDKKRQSAESGGVRLRCHDPALRRRRHGPQRLTQRHPAAHDQAQLYAHHAGGLEYGDEQCQRLLADAGERLAVPAEPGQQDRGAAGRLQRDPQDRERLRLRQHRQPDQRRPTACRPTRPPPGTAMTATAI